MAVFSFCSNLNECGVHICSLTLIMTDNSPLVKVSTHSYATSTKRHPLGFPLLCPSVEVFAAFLNSSFALMFASCGLDYLFYKPLLKTCHVPDTVPSADHAEIEGWRSSPSVPEIIKYTCSLNVLLPVI